MLLITKVLLGFLFVLTVAEAVPVLLNTTSVVDPIPVGAGSSLLADEKTGPYRLTFFKSAIGNNKDITTNENNNKTVEVLMNKSNEEINQTVHDESSMEEGGDPIEMKFTGGDWSKKLTKIIDKESSSGIDSSSSSSEEDSSSSSEEDSSENGSGDSSESSEEGEGSEEEESKEEEEEEDEEGSEEEEEEKEEEKEEEGSEEEEEGEEEEEEKEEEEGEEEKEENEEEDEEGKEIEKVLNVNIKKTSAVITPAGTQLMNSSDHDVFHEMQRHHKKFGLTTKGTKLLFTAGLIPPFNSHFIQDNSIISSVVQPSTTPSSNKIKTMYSDWLKSLPEMKKLIYPSHPHFISSSNIKTIKKQNKADDGMNKSSGNQLTPGGTRLVSDDDDHWLSYRNDDVMHRQPSLLDDDSVQRFFRSAAAFRTLSPPPQ